MKTQLSSKPISTGWIRCATILAACYLTQTATANQPAPSYTERVIVGRGEILTPSSSETSQAASPAEKSIVPEAGSDDFAMVRMPIGKWIVAFENDVVEDVEIRADGTVTVSEPGRKSEGTVKALEGRVELNFADGRIEGWTNEDGGPQTQVTHWVSAAEVGTVPGIGGKALQPAGNGKWTSTKETRILRGLNLTNVVSRRATAGLPNALDIEELYEIDPKNPDKKRQKPDIFNLQILNEDRDPWVKIVPGSGQFYIEFTDRTFGPVPGDPFTTLNVLDVLVTRMKSLSLQDRNHLFTTMLTHQDDILQSAAYAVLSQLEGPDDADRASLVKLIKAELAARPNSTSAPAGTALVKKMENQIKAAGMKVHEWGTFTVLLGSNGEELEWYQPQQDLVGLPKFVQSPKSTVRLGLKTGTAMFARSRNGRYTGMDTMRMETPVLYFYPNQELDVKVTAQLAGGRITEVYPPSTTGLDGVTTWTGHLFPPNSPKKSSIPAATGPLARHYAAARNVPEAWLYRDTSPPLETVSEVTVDGAAPVVLQLPAKPTEHFIFYRGAGNASFRVSAQEQDRPNVFKITNRGAAISRLFALKISNGQTSWLKLDNLQSGIFEQNKFIDRSQTITFSAAVGSATDVASQLRMEMIDTITKEGLTPAEAAAMVATWDDLWFTEPGVRLLAILPQSVSDSLVPLKITPAPTELKRVFVARVEIITKAKEQALLSVLANPIIDLPASKQQLKELELGRFANGGLERAMVLMNEKMMSQFQTLRK
jgi:hypothetical protein